jgi:hypothetical protein
MSGNGKPSATAGTKGARTPMARVLTAEDLRKQLNGQAELVLPLGAILTPSAVDELRSRGVRIVRKEAAREQSTGHQGRWRYAQEQPYPVVQSVADALRRDGVALEPVNAMGNEPVCRWARTLAESIAQDGSLGLLVFCEDPGLLCCVANKVAGVRAAAAVWPLRRSVCVNALAANLVAIDIAGRTFFELKQLVKAVCTAALPTCSGEIAAAIEELERHARR